MSKPSSTAAAPRLSIAHFLLWLVCCCCYLAVIRGMLPTQPSPAEMLLIMWSTSIDALTLAGLSIWCFRRFGNTLRATEPGEWLLAILGARLCVFVATETLLQPFLRNQSAILLAASCCCLVLPTLSHRLSDCWRLVFFLLVCVHLLPLAHSFAILSKGEVQLLGATARFVQQNRSPLIVLLLVAATVHDFRAKQLFDWSWLHWLGLVATVASLTSPTILAFVSQ